MAAMIETALGAAAEFVIGKQGSAALRDRLFRSVSGLLATRFAFSGLSFVLTALLARVLGVEAFGVYSYALAWVILLSIPALLGMDQLLVREVAACDAKSEWGLLRGLLQGATRMVFLGSLALTSLAAAAAWAFMESSASQMLPTLWIALSLLPLIALTQVRRAAMQGFHRVVLGSISERLLQPALLLLLIGSASLLFHARLTAPIAVTFNVFSNGVALAGGTWLLYRVLPQTVREAVPVYQDSVWIRRSLPLMFVAGASIVFAQADTLILGALKGARDLSTYSVADRSAELMNLFVMVQNSAFASTAASLFATGDSETLQRLVTRITRSTLLAGLPIAVGLIGFGRWFLTFCYGSQYSAGTLPLAILTAGQLVSVALGSAGMLLVMTGHAKQALLTVGVSAAANIVLNLALIPQWGQDGAAAANTLSVILLNVLNATILYRKTLISSAAFKIGLKQSHI